MGSCCPQSYSGSSASKPLLSDEEATKDDSLAGSGTKIHNKNDNRRQDSKWSSQLRQDAERDKKIKKLLLLGPGNSGKSTFFKQLLRIHGAGMDDLRKQYFHGQQSDIKRAIYDHVLEQIRAVIIQCRSFEYKLNETEEEAISYIESLASDSKVTEDVANNINMLWKNQSIQLSYHNRTNLSVVDSSEYFFNSLDRISQIDYSPTEKDILLVRTPTTGIISSSFKINENIFNVYDAGGQKCERSKWIHCFDNVTAVIFIASLSCFDQGLYENNYVNAMEETIRLWDEILNSRWFRPTSMILFLNKCDLFKDKLEKYNKLITVCPVFKDYSGNHEYKACIDYIRLMFVNQNKNPNGREVYTHITCATDKNNVEKVFGDVQNIVVNSALQRGGLL